MKYEFKGVRKFLDRARTKLRGTDALDAQHAIKACGEVEKFLNEVILSDGRVDPLRADRVLHMFKGGA
jgi:hypothetical protein